METLEDIICHTDHPWGAPSPIPRCERQLTWPPYSGMCAVCTANCTGPCEIGLSALRGAEAINPYQSDINQFASEKEYPLDFSHFNINGRVFGAAGCPEDADLATFPRADIGASFGLNDPIELDAPLYTARHGETELAGLLRRGSAFGCAGGDRRRSGIQRQGRRI